MIETMAFPGNGDLGDGSRSGLSALPRQIQEQLNHRRFDEALGLIAELERLAPQSADVPYFKGVSLYFQGRLGPAAEALKASLAIDPQHTDAAICLSVLYNDVGRYEDAKRVFEHANHSVIHQRTGDDLEVDRKFAVKHLEIADLYFRYRRYTEAIEEYGKAALLDPSALDIRIRRAKAWAKKGFLTRAMQELQQLKQEHPRYSPARIQLGLLHYSQNNVLDAELEWEGVLEQHSNHREARAYLEMAKQARLKGRP
jgi:tetratricopeptide (TPR) repeat protein